MSALLNPDHLLETFGYLGLFLVVFAESGLLVGFFLPGDSLLFTAGLFTARVIPGTDTKLNIAAVCVVCAVAAISGDQVGYLFGRRVGPAVFRRPNSRLFKQKYVEKSQAFFEEHGAKTIVLARFVPIVRTFAPILAGVGRMNYRTFVTYNVVGGLLWGVGVPLLGHFLGGVDFIADNIEVIAIIIVGISVLPVAFELLRSRRGRTIAAPAADDDVSTPTHAQEY
jgi:membrane-associated protein